MTNFFQSGLKIATEASLILFTTQNKKEEALESFLKKGAQLVKEQEPETQTWFGLKDQKGGYGIFDTFEDSESRRIHFAGQTASALKEKAGNLIEKGWEEGVLAGVRNYQILGATSFSTQNTKKAKLAVFIPLQAKKGKESELKKFLLEAVTLVEKEPKTLYWLALQENSSSFGIFDFFEDELGKARHFEGQAAKRLKEKASDLIQGGWQEGVLDQIQSFEVFANRDLN